MTPYAILLVRPVDSDETIRKRFHVLSKGQHPDRIGAKGTPGPEWYEQAAAYSCVKTEALRKEWAAYRKQLARQCVTCGGCGVVWKRIGKDQGTKVCAQCAGEGAVAKGTRRT